MPSFGGGVSWDDSVALVAFANAFLAHGVPVERPMWEPWPDWN
jgi:hypothetical protein